MNMAFRYIGALLIVLGMCILLAPTSMRHSSYTEPYVKIITQVFEFGKPSAEDIRLDPKVEELWHGTIAGVLEVYAAKVSSENRKNLFGMVLQLAGLSLLFAATGNHFRIGTLKQKG